MSKLEEYQLSFGRHKGKLISQVPTDYLEWIVENVTNRPEVVSKVKQYLSGQSKISSLSKVTTLSGLRKAPSKVTSLEQMGRRSSLQWYVRWVADNYERARFINISNCSAHTQREYRFWMDVMRKMQFVIDRDGGEGSPQSLQALRALWDAWARFVQQGQNKTSQNG